MREVQSIINSLVCKHGTCDPFVLASELGIVVKMENIGSVRGYYHKSAQRKFIVINNRLADPQARFTCAHELGHALLHPNENTPFLREATLFSVSKLETEANRFAVQLLMSGIENVHALPLSHIAALIGVPQEVILKYV